MSGLALALAIRSLTEVMPDAAPATSTFGAEASIVIGTKSRSMLKGKVGISVGLIVRLPAGTTNNVWPSGLARLTFSSPKLPAAPGMFSTMAAWL